MILGADDGNTIRAQGNAATSEVAFPRCRCPTDSARAGPRPGTLLVHTTMIGSPMVRCVPAEPHQILALQLRSFAMRRSALGLSRRRRSVHFQSANQLRQEEELALEFGKTTSSARCRRPSGAVRIDGRRRVRSLPLEKRSQNACAIRLAISLDAGTKFVSLLSFARQLCGLLVRGGVEGPRSSSLQID